MKKIIALVLILVLPLVVSCGSLKTTGGSDGSASVTPMFGAIAQDASNSDKFGAIMLSYSSEMLLPIVDRTDSDKPKLVGALWTDEQGSSVAVYIGDDGLPTKTVMGNFVLLFSNWDLNAGTVDIAKVYTWDNPTKTGHIETVKGGSIDDVRKPQLELLKGQFAKVSDLSSLTKGTCFPACETDTKNLAELLKFAGLGISVGACGVATTVSLGAMALPCAGVVISTATVIASDESWLNNLGNVGDILSGTDYFQCALGDVGACVGAAIDAGSRTLDEVDGVLKADENQPIFTTAGDALESPALQTGVVQAGSGILSCPNRYECEPGHYLPCFAGGTRKCGTDCMWASCPVVKKEDPVVETPDDDSGSSDTGCQLDYACGQTVSGGIAFAGGFVPKSCACPTGTSFEYSNGYGNFCSCN